MKTLATVSHLFFRQGPLQAACVVIGLSLVTVFPLTVAPMPAFAQQAAVAPQGIDAEAMKVLVAPVALYPDDVLAIVLPASTTGLQIVQAQRFLEQHQSNSSLQPSPDWDPSILALLNYPDVLARLNADLDWTQRLGDAVINQQADVMEAVQQIRNEAVASGYLKSDSKTIVTQQQSTVIIQPANPQVIYVPNYDPQVIVQQTYVQAPPPVYYNPYPPYYSPAATFFTGVAIGGALAYAFDWGHHDINVHYDDHDHHDDHHDNNDHHDDHNNNFNNINIHNNNNNNNNDHRGNNDRKPGQGGDFTWHANQKRPAARPTTLHQPAGLAPVNKLNHPATLPAKNNNAPAIKPKPATNNQFQNRIGNAPTTGKAGGFGNVTPARQTNQQQQRGAQSLQGKTQQFKAPQYKAPQAKPQKAPSFSHSKGGAFSGSSSSGAAVKAQQQRGGASRPPLKKH